MKSRNRALMIALAAFILAVLIALPFGVHIYRKEGWEGIWKRKRANLESVAPSSEPALDKVEESLRDSGAIK